MDNLENKVEQVISQSNFKQEFCNRLNAYITPTEMEALDKKIDEILKTNQNAPFDTVLQEVYTFFLNNLPDHVNEKLKVEITDFINQNSDAFQ